MGGKKKPVMKQMVKRTNQQKLVRAFRSVEEDLKWVRRGLVATVINGEAIPLIQSRISDAGFKDLDFIPLGLIRYLYAV